MSKDRRRCGVLRHVWPIQVRRVSGVMWEYRRIVGRAGLKKWQTDAMLDGWVVINDWDPGCLSMWLSDSEFEFVCVVLFGRFFGGSKFRKREWRPWEVNYTTSGSFCARNWSSKRSNFWGLKRWSLCLLNTLYACVTWVGPQAKAGVNESKKSGVMEICKRWDWWYIVKC